MQFVKLFEQLKSRCFDENSAWCEKKAVASHASRAYSRNAGSIKLYEGVRPVLLGKILHKLCNILSGLVEVAG